MRPRVSMLPPGGNGMISRTARSGKVCARAGVASVAIDARTNAATSLRELTTLSRLSLPCILHRRRQDDNDDGAERDRREARDRHGGQIPQPAADDRQQHGATV